MTTLQTIPLDLAGGALYRFVAHDGKHLQLTFTLSPEKDPAQTAWDLYLIDVSFFGCLMHFMDSYVDATDGAHPGEKLCVARLDGLVYNPKRFSREADLFLILRLEGAGFKLNCREFRFVNPALEQYQPAGAPDFVPKGNC